MIRSPRRFESRPVRRTTAVVAAVVMLMTALVGSAPVGAAVRAPASTAPSAADAFTPGAFNLHVDLWLGGFSKPVLVTHAGDGSGRLFVVEQTGKIKIVSGGAVLPTPFLDLSGYVTRGTEQGLLGLAFHPDYEINRKLYVYFTNPRGDIGINEYLALETDPNRAGSARRILSIDHPPARNHNGGNLAFGLDGLLYIGTGDGGGSGDPGNRAQSLSSLLGKILRIDVNGTQGSKQYRIPTTNPYRARAGLDEIWSRGLRNPWRFSFDPANGALFIGDVGQGRWEEIDRSYATASGAGRAINYGWRVLEGRHCFRPSSGCSKAGKVGPLVEYSHAGGNCSVTGGLAYRGPAQPLLQGGYLYGDFCSGRIWGVDAIARSPATGVLLSDTSLLISSFGLDEAGELYVVDLAGGIYRLSATAR